MYSTYLIHNWTPSGVLYVVRKSDVFTFQDEKSCFMGIMGTVGVFVECLTNHIAQIKPCYI